MCEGNLSALGEGSVEEREAAWDGIYKEYIQESTGKTGNPVKDIADKIEKKFVQFQVIEACVKVLRTYLSPDLVVVLRQNGYTFHETEDMPKRHEQLDKIMARAKKLLIDVENGKHQLDGMKRSERGEKVDRQYYNRCLSIFSKFQGGHIDERQITVGRYISIGNLYLEHLDALTEATKKAKK